MHLIGRDLRKILDPLLESAMIGPLMILSRTTPLVNSFMNYGKMEYNKLLVQRQVT